MRSEMKYSSDRILGSSYQCCATKRVRSQPAEVHPACNFETNRITDLRRVEFDNAHSLQFGPNSLKPIGVDNLLLVPCSVLTRNQHFRGEYWYAVACY